MSLSSPHVQLDVLAFIDAPAEGCILCDCAVQPPIAASAGLTLSRISSSHALQSPLGSAGTGWPTGQPTSAHTMHAFAYVHALNALAEGCIVCAAGQPSSADDDRSAWRADRSVLLRPPVTT